jgi:hypothetical protein
MKYAILISQPMSKPQSRKNGILGVVVLAFSITVPAFADNLLQGGVEEQGAGITKQLQRETDMQPLQAQPPTQQAPPLQPPIWNQQQPMQGQVWGQPPMQGQVWSQQAPPMQGQIGAQQFAPPLQGQMGSQQFPPLQGNGQSTILHAQASGGEESYGVLGAVVDEPTGMLKTVFPESDLNRFGVHPGDRILGINGHRYDPSTWQAECRGIPGGVIELVIAHEGLVSTYPVKRTDSRALAGKASYYRKWANRTRSW